MANLMVFIEASGPDGASFNDSIEAGNARYPTTPSTEKTTMDKIGISIRERDFYLSLIFDERLVKGSRTKNGVHGLLLTLPGHEWLKNYRDQTWTKRALRWVGKLSDKVITSVVLPLVVAILTVVALKFLENPQ